MLASEVSKNRRIIQCLCAIFWCLLSGGPIFGFAALKPVLIKEHIYEKACDISINSTDSLLSYGLNPDHFTPITSQLFNMMSTNEESPIAKCTAQDLKLNMMFTVGAVMTNVSALVIGRVLDIYGPRVCGMIGAIFLYLACFIFMFNKALSKVPMFDPYLIGYASMALGGPFAYISSFQLSNSFPQYSGSILAILTGAFDSSSAVFLFYRIFYNKSGGSFKLDKFFGIYLAVPVFITLAQVLVMPGDSYKTSGDTTLCVDDGANRQEQDEESAVEETDSLLNTQHSHHSDYNTSGRRDSIGDALKQPYATEGEVTLVEHSGGVFGILHGYSAQYQLKTPWFYLMCLFATIQMLRLNYFVATINTQYGYLFQSFAKADKLTRLFDIALPLGGVISIPFVGVFLDNCSTVLVLAVLLAVSLIIGVLGLLANYIAAVVNVLMFVGYRPFFYTAVSDFCAKVFGFDTFGTVYGSIICISGIINFGQSLLDQATHNNFNMNPTPINIMLVIATVIIGLLTVGYTQHQAKLYRSRKLNQSHS